MLTIHALQKQYKFAFTFSGCINTKSAIINTRVHSFNTWVQEYCLQNAYTYVNNANITIDMLRDQVHLNQNGCHQLLNNLNGLL